MVQNSPKLAAGCSFKYYSNIDNSPFKFYTPECLMFGRHGNDVLEKNSYSSILYVFIYTKSIFSAARI